MPGRCRTRHQVPPHAARDARHGRAMTRVSGPRVTPARHMCDDLQLESNRAARSCWRWSASRREARRGVAPRSTPCQVFCSRRRSRQYRRVASTVGSTFELPVVRLRVIRTRRARRHSRKRVRATDGRCRCLAHDRRGVIAQQEPAGDGIVRGCQQPQNVTLVRRIQLREARGRERDRRPRGDTCLAVVRRDWDLDDRRAKATDRVAVEIAVQLLCGRVRDWSETLDPRCGRGGRARSRPFAQR